MIGLQTSVKQDDTTRTRTPKPGYLNLSIPKYRTPTGQRTFKYRETKIWNALDEDLKSIVDINNFKSKLKAGLLEGNIQFTF
jgi:hypothetical protein